MPPERAWQEEIPLTLTLVPVILIVCGPLTLSLLTVIVADSFDPDGNVGVNRRTMVQLPPDVITRLFEHDPCPVLAKSDAFAPVMLKYGEPNVKLPLPEQMAMFGVEQLFTEMLKAAEDVFVP